MRLRRVLDFVPLVLLSLCEPDRARGLRASQADPFLLVFVHVAPRQVQSLQTGLAGQDLHQSVHRLALARLKPFTARLWPFRAIQVQMLECGQVGQFDDFVEELATLLLARVGAAQLQVAQAGRSAEDVECDVEEHGRVGLQAHHSVDMERVQVGALGDELSETPLFDLYVRLNQVVELERLKAFFVGDAGADLVNKLAVHLARARLKAIE